MTLRSTMKGQQFTITVKIPAIWNFRFPVPPFHFPATCILFMMMLSSFNLFCQISQPAIYERLHKNGDHEFIVISMGDQGLALIRDTEKFEDNKKSWEAIFVDSTLNESWTTKIEIDQRLNIRGHDYRDGNVYLIFEEPENIGRKINLIEILFAEKVVKQHEFKPNIAIRYTHFSVLRNKAVFAGYFNREPTLLMYDLDNESTKVIPGTFLSKQQLMDVRNNSNNTFNVVLAERDANFNKKIVVRTFDTNGVMLVDDVISLDADKSILEAMTSTLMHDELVIMGTWTYSTNTLAAGIFSVLVDPFNEQKVNYYDFAELNHFLDYLKPKRVAKIKAKAEWRKSVGKQPEFKTHLYTVRVDENKDGFSLLTEVYDPPTNYYNIRSSSPYGYNPYYGYSPYASPYGFNSMPYRYYNSPYGYPYSTPYANLNDTRMLHTSLSFFDNRGKLIADQSIKFPELKLNSKEQVSDFIRIADRTVMVCKQEKEILVQVNEPDGTVIQNEKIKPALKDPGETARSESQENSAVRFWYRRYFYVYGYHTVKSAENKSRDVFYINKLRVD
jgi:hypothetical protein